MLNETRTLILIRIFIFIYLPDFCCSIQNLQVCTDLLPNGYEIQEPPVHGGKPTNIFTWVQILDFGDINQANMDYLLHAFVTHIWNDSRLSVDKYKGRERATYLHDKCRDYVWTPYIFYETVKDAKPDVPHLSPTEFKILPDGAVSISTKFIFRAFCPMYLEHFPFDTQTCAFKISLLTSNILTELQWIGGPNSPYVHERTSVEVQNEPQLLLFYFKEPVNESVVDVYTEGNYTTLIIKFKITRHLIGCILNMYIPSTMIVVMSWIGFWLGVENVPARVALSVTSLLTLCTQVQQYRTELPPANYVKAMDIWLFVCIFFVFSTLVEFALCYNNQQQQFIKQNTEVNDDVKKLESEKNLSTNSWATNSAQSKAERTSGKYFEKKNIQEKWHTLTNRSYFLSKTDEICRILFPTLFLIFATTYWIYYLNMYGK